MIPAEYITEEELDKRFDTLSPKLKEALTSDRNFDIVKEICARNHIVDEEKVLMFQQIVALIIMGFIHYYDAGQEINEALNLNNPKFSAVITDELTAKIFSPIKAELEGVYQPILATDVSVAKTQSVYTTSEKNSAVGPKILTESRPVPIPAPAPGSFIPQPPVPKPLSEKGWSTMQVSDISPKPQPAPMPFSQMPIKIPIGVPTPSVMPMPRPPMAPPGMMGQQGMSSLSIPPQAPKPAPMPTMIIQGDNAPKPIKNAPDFHSVKSTQNMMSPGVSSVPVPVRPIILEMAGMPTPALGKTSVPTPPVPQAKAPSSDVTRVVHYSDLKSSLPSPLPLGKPPIAESGRQVVEMTAATPIPQMPISKPITAQNPTPVMTITSPSTPIPMSKPVPAPALITMRSAMPTPVVPMPPIPKPTMPSLGQMPPLPPKPGNPPLPSTDVPRPIPEKIIVKDFTEGK